MIISLAQNVVSDIVAFIRATLMPLPGALRYFVVSKAVGTVFATFLNNALKVRNAFFASFSPAAHSCAKQLDPTFSSRMPAGFVCISPAGRVEKTFSV